jgi:hypothetical protein
VIQKLRYQNQILKNKVKMRDQIIDRVLRDETPSPHKAQGQRYSNVLGNNRELMERVVQLR